MRRTMTDKGVAALKARLKTYAVPDPELRGLWIRIAPSGRKSFCTIARTPDHKQVWTVIGPADMHGGIAAARESARIILQRVREGLPAVEPKSETFAQVAANWITRHVQANGVRSAKEISRLLTAQVLPAWGNREFTAIRRNDVALLLDKVQDDHGARTADAVLGIVRAISNWYATRDENYNSPIVRGMRRWNAKEHERKRILSDAEIRAVWQVAEANGTFGVLVRLLLLTVQRLDKVQTMRWSDIAMVKMPTEKRKKGSAEELALWSIPTEKREKSNAEQLLLPELATEIIRAQLRFAGNSFVLAGSRNGRHYNNPSDGKQAFDRKLAEVLADVPRWTLHDLRRTARSLMSRAKVLSEHAERVLGHAVGGVEGTYDRHTYSDEKADALKRLAALIDSIVHPRPADVVPLECRRKEVTPL